MNADYERFRKDLERIDAHLRTSHVESLAIEFALESLPAKARAQDRSRRAKMAVEALRIELLRHVLGVPSFRLLSQQIAASDLLASFCGLLGIDGIRRTSKSTLDRASKLFTPSQLQDINQVLTEVVSNADLCPQVDLAEPVDASICLVDSTCLEANIHYPTDWVLLKDVSQTLLKAIILIRREGLLNRMEKPPEALAREMNRLCIDMTHSRRRKDGKKHRKSLLRQMKHLLKTIGEHAARHRDLLAAGIAQTCWSECQANRIIARIDRYLGLLPKVIHQAHERIIGGRLIPSAEKILSAHQDDLHTLVRGKAGKEVEFGNNLLISESPDGFILDYALSQGPGGSEADRLRDSLKRMQAFDIEQPVQAVVTDRGFDTKTIARELEADGITNCICPRNRAKLKERMSDETFRALQTRRGSTEARIAILKNRGGGRVCRAKGFTHRAIAVGFGVLAHNLWWLARKVRENEREAALQAA